MVDANFLADLQRSPDAILAQYELSDDERTAIRQALARLDKTPSKDRSRVLRNALIRRVAT